MDDGGHGRGRMQSGAFTYEAPSTKTAATDAGASAPKNFTYDGEFFNSVPHGKGRAVFDGQT